jgi:hypothetical protein
MFPSASGSRSALRIANHTAEATAFSQSLLLIGDQIHCSEVAALEPEFMSDEGFGQTG